MEVRISLNKVHYQTNEKKEGKGFLINFFVQLIIYFMVGNASITENNNLLLAVVALAVIYCIITDVESLFCLVVGLSIFDYAFNINGMNATIIPSGILLVKLLIKNKFVLFRNRNCVICAILILICEICGDCTYYSLGEVLLVVVNILLFIYLIANLELLQMDLFNLILYFAVACLVAIYCMLSMYGDISVFFDLLFTSFGLYRFGIGNANVMGGAMSLPLYALMLSSMSLAYILVKRRVPKWRGIILLVVNIICVFFAFLTISRSLYLGAAGVFLAILLGNKKYKESKFFKLFFVFVIALIGALVLYGDVIEQAITLLLNRLITDTDGAGRYSVWESCIDYMIHHPISLIIGNGACRYPTLNADLGAGAHNLFLDIFMSWGLLGACSLLYLIVYAIEKIRRSFGKIESMSYIPLFAFLAFALTALRSSSLKTWSFLLVTILVVQCLSKKMEEYK